LSVPYFRIIHVQLAIQRAKVVIDCVNEWLQSRKEAEKARQSQHNNQQCCNSATHKITTATYFFRVKGRCSAAVLGGIPGAVQQSSLTESLLLLEGFHLTALAFWTPCDQPKRDSRHGNKEADAAQ
jgi:hypothetical protein